jgi:hypothetical protein
MKVTTSNPVIVNGKHESEPSKYLSANGMGEYETTLHDVASKQFDDFYDADGNGMGEFETTLKNVESGEQNNPYAAADGDDFYNADGDDDYYGFDANGNPTKPEEVKMFQKWVVTNKGANIDYTNSKGQKIVFPASVDGVMTPKSKTKKLFDQYGQEWINLMKATGLAIGNAISGGSDNSSAGTPPVDEQISMAKQGKVWDKAKGWIASGKAQEVLGKVQEAGGIRALLGGIFGKKGGASSPPTDAPTDMGSGDGSGTPPPPQGMSKGMKIGLAVGGVLVLATIIYFATRNKGAVATTPLAPVK